MKYEIKDGLLMVQDGSDGPWRQVPDSIMRRLIDAEDAAAFAGRARPVIVRQPEADPVSLADRAEVDDFRSVTGATPDQWLERYTEGKIQERSVAMNARYLQACRLMKRDPNPADLFQETPIVTDAQPEA